MKMQNLWLEHTSNAAGAILDNTVRYSTVSLGYDIGNGTFRRPQEGKRVNSLDFKTEGGGIYEGLHGMYVWVVLVIPVIKYIKLNTMLL